jgi:hypothetical protein
MDLTRIGILPEEYHKRNKNQAEQWWLIPSILFPGRPRLGGLWSQNSSGKKVCETPISMEKHWFLWHMSIIPAIAGILK